jgi:hypothetical protein
MIYTRSICLCSNSCSNLAALSGLKGPRRGQAALETSSKAAKADSAGEPTQILNCPGFDGGCILWEDVVHVSIEAASAEARIGTPTSS